MSQWATMACQPGVGLRKTMQELMLGLASQEPKGGNNAQQQGMGKNGFCQANRIYF